MPADEDRKLFVAGLSDAATEDALRGLFEGAGFTVVDISVPRDRATGRARGFSFVSLQTAAEAAGALRQLDGTTLDGRSISVRAFRGERSAAPSTRMPRPASGEYRGAAGGPGLPPSQRGPRPGGPPRGPSRPSNEDATVYVGNLPFDALPEDVSGFFSESGLGEVKRVHLPTDPEGRRRGFGFVTLQDEDAAKKAAETLDGSSFSGRSITVNLARRGAGPAGGGAGAGPGAAPAQRSLRPPPRPFTRPEEGRAPEPAPDFNFPEPTAARDDEAWKARKEKKKEKKRKGGKGQAVEKPAVQKQRRKNEEFRSSRAKDYIEDWDDD